MLKAPPAGSGRPCFSAQFQHKRWHLEALKSGGTVPPLYKGGGGVRVPVVPLKLRLCERTNRQTDRQTYKHAYRNTPLLSWEQSKNFIGSVRTNNIGGFGTPGTFAS